MSFRTVAAATIDTPLTSHTLTNKDSTIRPRCSIIVKGFIIVSVLTSQAQRQTHINFIISYYTGYYYLYFPMYSIFPHKQFNFHVKRVWQYNIVLDTNLIIPTSELHGSQRTTLVVSKPVSNRPSLLFRYSRPSS